MSNAIRGKKKRPHDELSWRMLRLERVLVVQAATITTLQRTIARLVTHAGPEVAAKVTQDVIEGIEAHVAKTRSDDSALDGILRKQRKTLADFAGSLSKTLGVYVDSLDEEETKRDVRGV